MSKRTFEVTDAEYRVLVAATEAYRRIKGAERMLKCQRDTSLYPGYDTLIEHIHSVQAVLEAAPSDTP